MKNLEREKRINNLVRIATATFTNPNLEKNKIIMASAEEPIGIWGHDSNITIESASGSLRVIYIDDCYELELSKTLSSNFDSFYYDVAFALPAYLGGNVGITISNIRDEKEYILFRDYVMSNPNLNKITLPTYRIENLIHRFKKEPNLNELLHDDLNIFNYSYHAKDYNLLKELDEKNLIDEDCDYVGAFRF